MAYRIAVVDDEPTMLKQTCRAIREQAEKCRFSMTLFPFSSAIDLEEYDYDAYFLDIDMPGMDGIQLAHCIRESGSMNSIIFVSNVEEKVFEALRAEPLRFIRKTRLVEEMPEALSALNHRLEAQGNDTLVVMVNRERLVIPIHDILYVEGLDKTQQIVTTRQVYTVYSTMSYFEKELENRDFFRIQRSYLVNMKAVISIKKGETVLANRQTLPISREKMAETKRRFERMVFA